MLFRSDLHLADADEARSQETGQMLISDDPASMGGLDVVPLPGLNIGTGKPSNLANPAVLL